MAHSRWIIAAIDTFISRQGFLGNPREILMIKKDPEFSQTYGDIH